LEHLRLVNWTAIASQDLECLAGLTRLKSLALEDIWDGLDKVDSDPSLLSRLPALPNLEALDLQQSGVFDDDLQYVAALSRLKSLNLNNTEVTGEGLAQLASLGSLEELAIGADAVSMVRFESLLKFKRLMRLHIEYIDRKF